METEKQYFTAKDVMQVLGVGRSTAYSIIKQCNKELKELGKITIRGKVNAKYLLSRIEAE